MFSLFASKHRRRQAPAGYSQNRIWWKTSTKKIKLDFVRSFSDFGYRRRNALALALALAYHTQTITCGLRTGLNHPLLPPCSSVAALKCSIGNSQITINLCEKKWKWYMSVSNAIASSWMPRFGGTHMCMFVIYMEIKTVGLVRVKPVTWDDSYRTHLLSTACSKPFLAYPQFNAMRWVTRRAFQPQK